jgi:uncharacterized membrane protein
MSYSADQDSRRSAGLVAAAAVALSIALHVVPQMLQHLVDPAWSMLVLLIIDAGIAALIARSRAAVLIGIVLVVLLGVTVASHQQMLAALPSIALNLLLAVVFGATLRRHETPLIVRIAELDDPSELTPRFTRYLRALTVAWTMFFIVMALSSLLLMLYAPFEWWSLFVNVLTWPLIGLMFAAEWAVRRAAFPDLPAHTPMYIATRVFAYRRHAATAQRT